MDEALVYLERSYELEPIAWTLAAIGRVHALAGRREQARDVLERLAAMSKQVYVSPYTVASVHACLGEPGAAFALLEEGLLQRSEDLMLFRTDPRMDRLRSDPRYEVFMSRLGFPANAAGRLGR